MPAQEAASFRVVSAIPGRVRIQAASRHGRDGRLPELAARLGTVAAVLHTDVVADASSVIVRYAAAQRDLATVVRDIEATAAAVPAPTVLPVEDRRPIASSSLDTFQRAGRTRSAPAPGVSLLHSFPGRLRVRVPRLRRRQEVAAPLAAALGRETGIQQVEARPDQEFLIVRYDASVHQPAGVIEIIKRLLARLPQVAPPLPTEITCARDIPPGETKGLKPLLLPTVAVALAATKVMPPFVVGSALALAAMPLAGRAAEGVRARRFNVDQLDITALLVLALRRDFLIGSVMTWLIGLGDVIRARTMGRSRRAVSELMSPAKQQAWVERDEVLVSVPVNLLERGSTVLVYPGDQIPADGVVIKGQALVDEKVLTGESVPVPKTGGDAVYALTMVAEGQIGVRVEHIGKETRAGQVVAMIENAPLSDTRIQNYAAKIGDRLVGPIFGLALATYLLGGDSLRVAGVLILDFASGIRVSAPTTILSAMTGAAKQGLFIKGGRAMENLARVDAVVFDKTGTLTPGEPVITGAHALDPTFTPDDVLRLAASAEAKLQHPAAKAIVDTATKRGLEITPPTKMDYAMGLGMRAVIAGQIVQVGSERYLRGRGVDLAPAEALTAENRTRGNSLVYVAADGVLVGLLTYADPPRAESANVVRALAERGVKRIIMVTGDNQRAARAIAAEVGITEVIAEAFPEQKADVVQCLRRQGYTVAVIGDGINDSPAFMRADIGVSLPHGADVAKEMADVILLDGDLRSLPRALDLSRDAMRILRQNVNIVVWPTALGIAASLVGRATPLLSTLISHGTTIIAGLNGLRPLFPKAEPGKEVGRKSPLRVAPRPSAPPESALRARVWPIIKRLPTYLRLAWTLSREPAIPWRHKTLLYLFPIYYVSPAHLLVHPIPVIGQIDGVLFLVLALRQALTHCPREVLARHLTRLNLASTQLEKDWETALFVLRQMAGKVGDPLRRKQGFAGHVAGGFGGERPASPAAAVRLGDARGPSCPPRGHGGAGRRERPAPSGGGDGLAGAERPARDYPRRGRRPDHAAGR